MTTLTNRNVPMVEGTDPADIAARINPVAQLVHDRPGVSALTTTQRNALTGAELWDGRVILNTTTDRLNRYDAGTTTWIAVADFSEIAALLATTGTPAGLAVTGDRGVSTSAARADHVHPAPGYTAYTPTWTGTATNPTLGNGSLVGAYQRIGKHINFDIILTIGSNTTLGSGRWDFSLPSTPHARYLTLTAPLGHATALDFSSRPYQGTCLYVGGGKVAGHRDVGAEATYTPTSPFAFVVDDKVHLHGFYEEA